MDDDLCLSAILGRSSRVFLVDLTKLVSTSDEEDILDAALDNGGDS